MTRAVVKAIVSNVKYRSWRITVDDSGDIKIAAPATCAYTKGKRKRVTVYGYVENPQRYRQASALLFAISEGISSILHHEIAEWFTYRGRRPFDPHK